MLNLIWPIFIIVSFIYAISTGNISKLNSSVFNSTESSISLSITLLGTVCLWNGIMRIAMETTIVDKIKKVLSPVLRILFKDVDESEDVHKEISINIIANILGLGNAATPLGLKAMKSLQKKNTSKERLSNSMAMLIVINTASIQIIPTTVIAIRTSLGSNDPTKIIIPVWVATACAGVAAIVSAKIFMKRW